MERAIQVQLNLVPYGKQRPFRTPIRFQKTALHPNCCHVRYLSYFILENMDKQKLTGAVFIDLKTAFDLVNHKCLLYKLEH